MHEYAIAVRLIEIVATERAQRGISELPTHVVVEVGEISGVVGGALAEAFRVARIGSVCEDAELDVVHVPLRLHCRHCGRDWDAENPFLFCESCQGRDVEVGSGRELIVHSVEFREAM
jgi:hydrogenase nickel incorporation protein HypA/HybF